MEYYHYMHALSSCVVGPPFEYGEGNYTKIRPFSNYIPAFSRLLQGFVSIAISNAIAMKFDLFFLIDPAMESEPYYYKMIRTFAAF
jgi:hypothetical protein